MPQPEIVRCNIDTANGNVVIAFTRKIFWFQMTPQEAVDFAEAIMKKVMKIKESFMLISQPTTKNHLGVDISNGNIIIDFEWRTAWHELSPEDAIELARVITEQAVKLVPGGELGIRLH